MNEQRKTFEFEWSLQECNAAQLRLLAGFAIQRNDNDYLEEIEAYSFQIAMLSKNENEQCYADMTIEDIKNWREFGSQ